MRGRGLSRGVLLSLALAAPAAAESARTPAVWYRAAAECPAGADFLAKIADGAPRAHLARAGDHIDFVVTLLTSGAETVGRLERQTKGGTVAIRELRDATCERVADALALSLGLALDPARPAAEAETEANSTMPALVVPDAPAPAPPAPTRIAAPPATTAVVVAPIAVTPPRAPSPAPPLSSDRRPSAAPSRAWSWGLDAGVLSGPAPLMARGSLFADVNHSLPMVADNLSLRVSLLGALGSSSTTIGPVRRWVLGGRGEACPWRWGSERFGLRPCLAFELGATGASSDRETALDAHTLWAAPGVGLRAALGLLPALRLEAAAGVLVPLLRDQIFAGSQALTRDSFLSVYGTLGVSLGAP
jgi:hypothetical protein